MSVNGKKLIPIFVFLAVTITIYTLASSAITHISPEDMTRTAMGETVARMGIYLHRTRKLPDKIDMLPIRKGYANFTTDGWGHSLKYTRDGDQFAITSLGKDGEVGGDGADADIVEQYRLIDGEIESL
jgi:hypothetical protein